MQFLEQPAHPKGPAYELSEFLDKYRQAEQTPPAEVQPPPAGGAITRKMRELFTRKTVASDAWDVEAVSAPEPPVVEVVPPPVPEPEPVIEPEPQEAVKPEVIYQVPESTANEELTAKVSSLADLVTQLATRDSPKTQGRRKLIVRRDTEGRIASIEEDDTN